MEVSNDISAKALSSNNANVLILEGRSVKGLKKEKNFRQADQLLVHFDPISLGFCLIFAFRYLIRGRLKPLKILRLRNKNNESRLYLDLKVASKKQRLTERAYFPTHWTNKEFLIWMDERKVNYVVLRWYNQVIQEQDVNDIDILIDDKDISVVRTGLSQFLGTRAVDLFALSGGETGGVDKMAYFPPKIGTQILKHRISATPHPGFLPNIEDQFLSLAYHALFRKGYEANLPIDSRGLPKASGKIFEELRRLQEIAGVETLLDMESLLQCLDKKGWVPPADMISRQSSNNQWIKDVLLKTVDYSAGLKGSYFVLVLREIVEQWDNKEEMIKDIQNAGFEIMLRREIEVENRDTLAGHLRGGNWSAGPWPVSGGRPCTILVVQDSNPLPISRKIKKARPTLQNARILFKTEWRSRVNDLVGKDNSANFVHTSDNNDETLEYLAHIAPDAIGLIKSADGLL
ncbi:MAG: hypothetical protein V7750_12510 [Sneathiella sp.]